ncbi:MAG: hypothetical protein ACKV2Q_29510 [Planctomycetaceae bacterium]
MSVNERDNTERCLNVLLRHLEQLRPILNTRDLDDRAIITARDLVKAFVLSETNAGPRGTIFRGEHFSETGEPLLGTPLGLNGPSSQVFWSEECADLLTDRQWSYMSMILNMLVAFAQESLTRERAELAKDIGNCASDFVESLTGKPWNSQKSDGSKAKSNGVSEQKLREAFEFIKEHGPVVGKNVARHIKVDEDAFRGRYVRLLKSEFGIQNKRGEGYFAP